MLVTYTPDGAEARDWEFDPKKVKQSHAELIEKRAGTNWGTFVDDVQRGSAKARKVLLWHLLRREHHTLRFEDTPDFCMGELEIDYSYADLRVLREAVAASAMTDDEKTRVLDRLDLEIANRFGDTDLAGDVGKAPSSSAG